MTYDAMPFIDVNPNTPAGGFGTWCRVVWRPREGGRTHRACAPYLDGEVATGVVTLGLGLDEWAEEVGLTLTEAESLVIRNIVDAQLAEQPWAEIACRAGKSRIELCPRPAWADGAGPPYTGVVGWVADGGGGASLPGGVVRRRTPDGAVVSHTS